MEGGRDSSVGRKSPRNATRQSRRTPDSCSEARPTTLWTPELGGPPSRASAPPAPTRRGVGTVQESNGPAQDRDLRAHGPGKSWARGFDRRLGVRSSRERTGWLSGAPAARAKNRVPPGPAAICQRIIMMAACTEFPSHQQRIDFPPGSTARLSAARPPSRVAETLPRGARSAASGCGSLCMVLLGCRVWPFLFRLAEPGQANPHKDVMRRAVPSGRPNRAWHEGAGHP